MFGSSSTTSIVVMTCLDNKSVVFLLYIKVFCYACGSNVDKPDCAWPVNILHLTYLCTVGRCRALIPVDPLAPVDPLGQFLERLAWLLSRLCTHQPAAGSMRPDLLALGVWCPKISHAIHLVPARRHFRGLP